MTSKRPTRSKKTRRRERIERRPTRLDLFAQQFPTEDDLRRALADLFRQMGHHGVQITHSSAEKGKDIIFRRNGPLEEPNTYACVVKNQPISGRANDPNGAMTIINQATQALDAPTTDGKGHDVTIDGVYIITPYDVPPTTIEAVKSTLKNRPGIQFIFGENLLALFAQYLKDFVCFESSTLTAYLSALRKQAEEDYALANLIVRKALGTTPGPIKNRYVQPTFQRELNEIKLDPLTINTNIFNRAWKHAEIQRWAKEIRYIASLLDTAEIWANTQDIGNFQAAANDIKKASDKIVALWDEAFRTTLARAKEDAARANKGRHQQGFAKSKLISADIPTKHDAIITLTADTTLQTLLATLGRTGTEALDDLQARANEATAFARTQPAANTQLFHDEQFLNYCRIADSARAAPTAFRTTRIGELAFSHDILDQASASVLITGAAGFGKTTFCRWHSLQDAERLVDRQARTLPVYVPLHTLLHGDITTYEAAFFGIPELKQLLAEQKAGTSPFDRVRLYLDGLDEVTPTSRQADITKLAQQACAELTFLQVVMTGRDHVAGHWLRWLPRIRLREFDGEQTRALAQKWLPADRVDDFFTKLSKTTNLQDLMGIPLLATLILAVYDKTNDIPPNKTTLYALFVELLAGGWDVYKNLQRGSEYGMKDKLTVLARLAGILHLSEKRDGTEAEFTGAVKASLAEFVTAKDTLLGEIVEDGLLTRIGGTIAFSHLSFQEFLAARDLQEPTGNRARQAIRQYLQGNDWWRDVLAFYVSMTVRPADIDEWIADNAEKTAIKANTPDDVDDLKSRASYLQQTLRATFPAYQPKGRGIQTAKLDRKLERLTT